jgi:hypothetical protein
MEKGLLKISGILGLLLTIPSIAILIALLILAHFPIWHYLVLEKLAIILCGVFGGLLLFAYKESGYIFLLIMTVLVCIRDISIFRTLPFRDISIAFVASAVFEIIVISIMILVFWKHWRRAKRI